MSADDVKKIASYNATTILCAYLNSNPNNPMRNDVHQIVEYYAAIYAAVKVSLQ